jgi:large subunit ribosomal protein L17
MKHKNGFNPLSRNASHLKAMHRNMVTSLFRYERVITTQPKALEVRRTAEKLITRSKVDTVHNRRQVARFISDEAVLAKLFNEIGPRMKERQGGYTRVLKLGFRQGDAAEEAILELVDYKLDTAEKAEKAEKKAEKKATKNAADSSDEKKPAAEKKAAVAKKPAAAKKAAGDKPADAKKAAVEKKPAAKKAKAPASAEE